METAIRSIGNSSGIVIPKKILEKVRSKVGDKVDMKVENGHIVIKPKKDRPKYKLSDLINKCDTSSPMSDELKAWEDSQAVGKEI